MECLIPGANLKGSFFLKLRLCIFNEFLIVLGKSLQALSKIGDELYIEAKKDRLRLITVNSSKTVCSRFDFLDNFFSSYEVDENDLKNSNNEALTCKIHMKMFLPLLKANLDKKVNFKILKMW